MRVRAPGTLNAVQRGVLRNALAALAVSALVLAGALLALPAPRIPDTAADRMAFALPWLLVSAAALLLGVASIARYRFIVPAAADGGNPDGDQALAARRAYLQNTLEQTLLHAIAVLAFAAVAPLAWLVLVPAVAGWFVISRVFFRIGYARGASARAFGFGGTYYTTVVTYVLALWFWFAGQGGPGQSPL